jgi:glycine reductase
MRENIRAVHYVNQFFGGLGGEGKAGTPPQLTEGAVGPGRAIQAVLGDKGTVVATVICGDNYFGERIEQAADEIIEMINPYQPDILIAGPAFEAGRYGVACGAVCKAVQEKLGIPAVTGMFEENPGVEIYHKDTWIVSTGDSIRTMNTAVSDIMNLVKKLAFGEKVGTPSEDNYFPRGTIKNELAEKTGAVRAVEMLLKKLRGEEYETETVQPRHFPVTPAQEITNLEVSTIALVTDGGLVPAGNPDKIEAGNATKFGGYSIEGRLKMNSDDYDVNHGGYDTDLVKQDPNRLIPLDVMRDLEQDQKIEKIYNRYFVTAGVSTRAEMARKFGQSIAEELIQADVSGVILTST